MIAYFHKTRAGFVLTILADIHAEFHTGEKIAVTGRREARQVCEARGARPWNF